MKSFNKIIFFIISSLLCFFSYADVIDTFKVRGNIGSHVQLTDDNIVLLGIPIFSINSRFVSNLNKFFTFFGIINYDIYLNDSRCHGFEFNKLRLGYFGLYSKRLGFLTYGKEHGVHNTVIEKVNIAPIYNGFLFKKNAFMLNKAKNVISYKVNNLFNLVKGLDFKLQYQFENLESNDITQKLAVRSSNGPGYGAYFNYNINNIVDICGSYSNSSKTYTQKVLLTYDRNNAEAYLLGVKLNTKNIYVASMYGKTYGMVPYNLIPEENDIDYDVVKNENNSSSSNPSISGFMNELENFEIIAQYKFKVGLIPSIGYFQSKAHGIGIYSYRDISKFIEIGSKFSVNKNILSFIDFKINLLKSDDFYKSLNLSTSNEFGYGVFFSF